MDSDSLYELLHSFQSLLAEERKKLERDIENNFEFDDLKVRHREVRLLEKQIQLLSDKIRKHGQLENS